MTLADFDRTTTGSEPQGNPYVDAAGNVFGTAEQGGSVANLDGAVWEYTAATATIGLAAGFSDGVAGEDPIGAVVPDGSGNLIGTTAQSSGSTNTGTVFSADPATGAITTLATFTTATTGYSPEVGLTPDGSGDFFGVSSAGTANGRGAVVELAPSTATHADAHPPPPTPTPTPTPTGTGVTPTVLKSTLATSVISGTKAKGGSVLVTVTNSTAATVTGTTTVALYATTTGAIDSASTLIGSVPKRLKLAAGRSATVAVPVHSLQLSAGTYTVLPQVTDPSGTVVAATAGPTVTVAAPFVSLSAAVGGRRAHGPAAGQAALGRHHGHQRRQRQRRRRGVGHARPLDRWHDRGRPLHAGDEEADRQGRRPRPGPAAEGQDADDDPRRHLHADRQRRHRRQHRHRRRHDADHVRAERPVKRRFDLYADANEPSAAGLLQQP